MPGGRDAAALARAALADHVVLAPSNVFIVTQSCPDLMRFNVAQMDDPGVFAVLERGLAAPP